MLSAATTLGQTSGVVLGEARLAPDSVALAPAEAEAFPLAAASSGSATAVDVFVGSRSSESLLLAGVFSSLAGRPGTLLASGSLRWPRAGGWVAVPVGATPLQAGATYWLAVLGEGGTLRLRAGHQAGCVSGSAPRGRIALPSAWRSFAAGCPVSAYATGAPSTELPGGPIAEVPPVSEPPRPEPPAPPVEEPQPPTVPPPPPAPPTPTTAPEVAGTPVEGSLLTASSGTWSGEPGSFSYQWERCAGGGGECVAIAAATASSHTLASADVGHRIRVLVTASGAGGTTSAASAATAPVAAPPPLPPLDTAPPVISGQPVEGQALEASRGTWTGAPTGFAYQWQGCTSPTLCSNIAGATTVRYTAAPADVGRSLRVVVTATNAGGSTAANSAATASVTAPPPAAPVNTAGPVISGQPVEGQALEASNGTWSGSSTSFAYAWQRCSATGGECAAITGAAASKYTLLAADVGHALRVLVTASNAGGSEFGDLGRERRRRGQRRRRRGRRPVHRPFGQRREPVQRSPAVPDDAPRLRTSGGRARPCGCCQEATGRRRSKAKKKAPRTSSSLPPRERA